MSKKVGILTWHFLDNYGSILQAYALFKYLKMHNLDVEFINYVKDSKNSTLYQILRWLKYNLPSTNQDLKRRKKFYKFRHTFFKETKLYSNARELKNYNFNYDFIICGSDQIWSSKLFDAVYFLNFIEANTIPCYAYAPSLVEDKYPTSAQEIIKNELSKFQKLSTREEIGANILSKYTKKKVENVLDPTLILPQEEWNIILNQSNYQYENYILCYFIGDEDKYLPSVLAFQGKSNLKTVININIKKIHNYGTIIKDASPQDFLKLIKNASLVLTDSYHGVLFSLIFNKEFYAIKRFEDNQKDNQNERINDILTKLKLLDHYLSYNSNINLSKIDYSIVNQQLKEYQKKSQEYLDSIIKENQDDSNRE